MKERKTHVYRAMATLVDKGSRTTIRTKTSSGRKSNKATLHVLSCVLKNDNVQDEMERAESTKSEIARMIDELLWDGKHETLMGERVEYPSRSSVYHSTWDDNTEEYIIPFTEPGVYLDVLVTPETHTETVPEPEDFRGENESRKKYWEEA